MRTLRYLGLVVSALTLALACGDDSGKRTSQGEAGAGGEAGAEPGSAGAEPTTAGSGGGGGEGGAVVAPEPITLEAFCTGQAQEYFDWLQNCYGSDPYSEQYRPEFTMNNELDCLDSGPSVEAGRMSFDGVAAAGCLQAIDPMVCDGFDFMIFTPECANIFSPLVEAGGDCYPGAVNHFSLTGAPSECLDGWCDTTGMACPGQCVSFKENDEACSSGVECRPESHCSGDGFCTPDLADGETCTGGACAGSSSCLYPDGASEGTCVPRSVVGQACSETDPCSFGFYCLEGECKSKVGTGEPCEVLRNCPDGERCLDRDGEGPTCGGPGPAGTPCGGSADCEPDLYCPFGQNQVCTPRIAIGDPCMPSDQCEVGAWCNNELAECQALRGLGDPCLTFNFPALEACDTGLHCMQDGLCHPPGAENDPCHPGYQPSCQEGLFCSRVDFTCQPPAAEGEFCNYAWLSACAGDLGCLCEAPTCDTFNRQPAVHDTLHVCAPRRQEGDPCFYEAECEVGSQCLGDPPVCTAPLGECLP
jgi:hypothetical protein